VVDSGTGFANLFIPGSIPIVGDTIIALNERNQYSLVGSLADDFNNVFLDSHDDSTEDFIDWKYHWSNIIG
jgi:hypothetical protein